MAEHVTAELVSIGAESGLAQRYAIAGFLAGYTGATQRAYRTDLRIFRDWCTEQQLDVLGVHRTHLELFARWMEQHGRMRSTIARRLSTLSGFYRYCHTEGLITANPAANIRRPRVSVESRTLGLDRNELGALLVEAGLGSDRDHALISLLALNGLRISEALSADIDDLSTERGHRTLRILRKGGASVIVPLAPRTGRALDCYIADRGGWPNLPRHPRWADGPLRSGPHREAARPPGRDRQADLTTQPAALVHHRCLGRRCSIAGRARRR